MIGGDDFYAGGTAASWDERSPAEKAHRVISWQRQHRLLEDLRLDGSASWYPFAWEARWSSAEDHYFGVIMPPQA